MGFLTQRNELDLARSELKDFQTRLLEDYEVWKLFMRETRFEHYGLTNPGSLTGMEGQGEWVGRGPAAPDPEARPRADERADGQRVPADRARGRQQ
jgi:hypothetical protein